MADYTFIRDKSAAWLSRCTGAFISKQITHDELYDAHSLYQTIQQMIADGHQPSVIDYAFLARVEEHASKWHPVVQ